MKLFCKHKYKLYNVTSYCPLLETSRHYCYDFVCINCKKVKRIYSGDIEYEVEDLKGYVNKQEMLGENMKELNSRESLTMGTYYGSTLRGYEGKHIYLLIKKYLNKGIDLNEITHYHGW